MRSGKYAIVFLLHYHFLIDLSDFFLSDYLHNHEDQLWLPEDNIQRPNSM